eukprot:scaffold11757_cov21-Tisochrysis_lutea.AAC.1
MVLVVWVQVGVSHSSEAPPRTTNPSPHAAATVPPCQVRPLHQPHPFSQRKRWWGWGFHRQLCAAASVAGVLRRSVVPRGVEGREGGELVVPTPHCCGASRGAGKLGEATTGVASGAMQMLPLQ